MKTQNSLFIIIRKHSPFIENFNVCTNYPWGYYGVVKRGRLSLYTTEAKFLKKNSQVFSPKENGGHLIFVAPPPPVLILIPPMQIIFLNINHFEFLSYGFACILLFD